MHNKAPSDQPAVHWAEILPGLCLWGRCYCGFVLSPCWWCSPGTCTWELAVKASQEAQAQAISSPCGQPKPHKAAARKNGTCKMHRHRGASDAKGGGKLQVLHLGDEATFWHLRQGDRGGYAIQPSVSLIQVREGNSSGF